MTRRAVGAETHSSHAPRRHRVTTSGLLADSFAIRLHLGRTRATNPYVMQRCKEGSQSISTRCPAPASPLFHGAERDRTPQPPCPSGSFSLRTICVVKGQATAACPSLRGLRGASLVLASDQSPCTRQSAREGPNEGPLGVTGDFGDAGCIYSQISTDRLSSSREADHPPSLKPGLHISSIHSSSKNKCGSNIRNNGQTSHPTWLRKSPPPTSRR